MGLGRIRDVFRKKDFEYITDVDFQIDAIRTYIKATQGIIEVDIKAKISQYEEWSKEEDYWEMGFDLSEMEILNHTRILYYSSIFISISSFLEKKMFQLCQIAEQEQTVKTNDIVGKGIFKFHKYLTKVVGLDLKAIDGEWGKVVRNAEIRNKLVHRPDSEIKASFFTKATLEEYLKSVSKILHYIAYEKV